MQEYIHGTEWPYRLGCRCNDCRLEHNRRIREYASKNWYQLRSSQTARLHAEGKTCRWCS
jgi:hypothetical protein